MDELQMPDALGMGQPSRGAKIADMLRRLAPVIVATIAGRQAGPLAAGRVLQSSADFEAQQQQDQQRLHERHQTMLWQQQREQQARADRLDGIERERTDRAAQFRVNAITKLAEIDDPVTFTQAAEQLSLIYQQQYGGNPSDLKTGLRFSDAKKLKADQAVASKAVERANSSLGSERDAWDANPTLTLSDGRQMKYRDARSLAGLALTKDDGAELPPAAPAPKPTQGTASERLAKLKGEIRAAKAAGDQAKVATLQAEHDDILAAQKELGQADDRDRPTPDNSWKRQAALTAQQTKFSAEPIVKAYNEIAAKAQTISQILSGPQTGPGDLAIVFEFMKGLDPTSVVRETEYANAAKSGNIFKGIFAKFNGYLKEEGGFLPENVKREFLRLVQIKLNAQTAQYNNLRTSYGKLIDGITGEPGTGGNYLVDYGSAFPKVDTPPPPAPAATAKPLPPSVQQKLQGR